MRATPTRSFVWLSAMGTVVLIVAVACSTGSGTTPGTGAVGSAGPGSSAAASPASNSGGGGRYGGDYDDGNGSPATAAPASADNGEPEDYEVGVANGPDGDHLTGGAGMTLYVFGNDSANTSACDGGCASTWPPFIIGAGDTLKAGSGVKGKLTTFARSDGSMQVAYGGSPLYYYALDKAAGDTKGQGVGDVWYIAQP
jgi:predicted lipoprotein with Yx(FWY)xxD motif